jgi:hypothetical protein
MAPSPMDSASPACLSSGTRAMFSSCVMTSTTMAMRTGVRMSWLA